MPRPRVGVLSREPSGLPDAVRQAGAEPVHLPPPASFPPGGVALAREWTADLAEVSCANGSLDALLLDAGSPAELSGQILAALRLDLPSVCAAPPATPFSVALAALGLALLSGDAPEVAVALARDGGPRTSQIVDNFSLANALRAGVSAGGGPETLVHLSALAREAGVPGFSQMVRVLAPETPVFVEPDSPWLRERGAGGLLALLSASVPGTLHDARTVAGPLKGLLPDAPPVPDPPGTRLLFVRGRASGTEGVCRARDADAGIAGECRVFGSEAEAARAVEGDEIGPGDLVVVGGCGPRGTPGLSRLDALAAALNRAGLRDATVLTDGLAPDGAPGTWVSVLSPEAVAGGVIGVLRDGDPLRVDLREGRLRTGVGADEFAEREPFAAGRPPSAGYAARYARAALPALEGAGFG